MDITKIYQLLVEIQANLNAVAQGQAVIENESATIENVGNNVITIGNNSDILIVILLLLIIG